jgi:single-strand DNA-binding protein
MTTTKERSAPAGRSAADAGDPSADDRNEVRIVGRMSGEVAERVLPSGDPLVSFRVVTRRPGKGPTRVDTIEVSAWSARTRSAAARLVDGDRVEVEGALRRRFFRGGTGSTSRYEVEAAVVRRPR